MSIYDTIELELEIKNTTERKRKLKLEKRLKWMKWVNKLHDNEKTRK